MGLFDFFRRSSSAKRDARATDDSRYAHSRSAPPCQYCGTNCFYVVDTTIMPPDLQAHMQQYALYVDVASCPEGKAYEMRVVGQNWDTLRAYYVGPDAY